MVAAWLVDISRRPERKSLTVAFPLPEDRRLPALRRTIQQGSTRRRTGSSAQRIRLPRRRGAHRRPEAENFDARVSLMDESFNIGSYDRRP